MFVTVAAYVLLVFGVVGLVVCWRRARRFLTNLRIANENRNMARAESRSGAGAVARADVGGVHLHLGPRIGANHYDRYEHDDDDDDEYVLDVLARAGLDVRHVAELASRLDRDRNGDLLRSRRSDRGEFLQAGRVSPDGP